MFIKQLSVFIENRKGRLEQVLEVLKNENINIISLSLADTSEYGLLRMVVSNSELAHKVLKEQGYSSMLTDVIAVRLPHEVGKLQGLMAALCAVGINVEYMYALSTREQDASIIVKASDAKKAADVIKAVGFSFISQEEIAFVNQ